MQGDPQPQTRDSLLRYLPALDGLRALALLAVLLDHAELGIAPGGFLGVTTFFVLSGFLITSLLLRERDETGRIDLGAFWARRARRLVPAALLFVCVVAAYLAFGPARPPEGVLGDGIAALGWVANWRFVVEGRSYGDLFSDPTPFQHVWSLAVEEQFYLGLPLVAVVLLGRRGPASRRRFAAGVAAVIVASTCAAWLLHEPGSAPIRAYYGTDARMAELAVGVLLAVVLVPRTGLRRFGSAGTKAMAAAATAGLVGLGAIAATVDESDTFLYRGGLLLAALLAAAVVTAATQAGTFARVLGCRPLAALGRITYGAYLFHWPVFLWLSERSTGLPAIPLLVVRVAVTLAAASLSYRLLERPIRIGAVPTRVAGLAWANGTVAVIAVLAIALSSAPAPMSTLLGAGAGTLQPPPLPPPPPRRQATPPSVPSTSATTAAAAAVAETPTSPAAGPSASKASPATKPSATSRPRSTSKAATTPPTQNPLDTPPPPPSAPPTTVAGPVVPIRIAVVGDSLGDNLARGLTAWAQNRNDVVVYNITAWGCPLTRGGTRRLKDDGDFDVRYECGWWSQPDSERYGFFTDFDPDVVVVQAAVNELPDRYLPEWERYRRLGDPVLDRWLVSEYREALEFFGSDAKLVLLNAPCVDADASPPWGEMDDPDGRRRLLNVNYDLLARPDLTFGDLDAQVCPDGEFTQTVMGVENARPDGFHIIDEAATRIAERWLGPLAMDWARS